MKLAYGGAQETAAVRASALSEIVAAQAGLIKNASRIDLHNAQAVKEAAEAYMKGCAEYAILPTLEGFSASCGISRRWLYEFLEKYPESESAQIIDTLRTAWAATRIAAMDRGISDVTAGIFVLLNSKLGFSNSHQFEIVKQPSPLDFSAGEIEAARRRYLDELPQEDDN